MSRYVAEGSAVVLIFDAGDRRIAARCSTPKAAYWAAGYLQRARIANDVKRQYTKAARLIAQAEQTPGFHWEDA